MIMISNNMMIMHCKFKILLEANFLTEILTNYERKKQRPRLMFLILRKSCLTENMSNRN